MPTHDNNNNDKTSWSTDDESFLVDCLFVQKENALQTDSGFKVEAFTAVAAAFRERGPPAHGLQKTAATIKTKVNNLKGDYKVFHAMVQQSGWGWDEETGKVTCPDGVWDEYVQAHSKAKPFRKKGFPLYRRLQELFGDDIADGREAFRAGQTESQETEAEDSQSIPSSTSRGSLRARAPSDNEDDDADDEDDEDTHDHSSSATTTGKRGRSRVDAEPAGTAKKNKRQRKTVASVVETLAGSINGLGTAFANDNFDIGAGDEARYSRAVQLVEEEFESDHECIRAVDVVTESTARINTYLGYRRAGARKAWVMELMEKRLAAEA